MMMVPSPAFASASPIELARAQIEQAYPGARVAVAASDVSCPGGQAPALAEKAALLLDSGRGHARLSFRTREGQDSGDSECWVRFSAWMPAWVAKRRILPGEKLSVQAFDKKEIDVAQGMAREVRGLLLSPGARLSQLESRQTLLEGQPVLSSAVQQVPDVHRGEAVQIRMVSGGVTLSTGGTAEEAATLQGLVRVLTQRSKRVLTGKLMDGGVVEVRL